MTGNASAGNVSNGLNFWNATNNTIGGTSVLDRNVISGTTNIGINMTGASTGNQILGNYIGIGADGTVMWAIAGTGSIHRVLTIQLVAAWPGLAM